MKRERVLEQPSRYPLLMNRRGAPVCRGEHREASPEGGISRSWLVVWVRWSPFSFPEAGSQSLGEYVMLDHGLW